jgi:hypothetical protein
MAIQKPLKKIVRYSRMSYQMSMLLLFIVVHAAR